LETGTDFIIASTFLEKGNYNRRRCCKVAKYQLLKYGILYRLTFYSLKHSLCKDGFICLMVICVYKFIDY